MFLFLVSPVLGMDPHRAIYLTSLPDDFDHSTVVKNFTARAGGTLYHCFVQKNQTNRTSEALQPHMQGVLRDTYEIESLLPENKGAYEMVISIQNAGASKIELTLSNTKGEKIYMYYNVPRKQFVMDRSESGLVNFSQDFPAVTVAPIHDTDDIQLRLFLDRSSIEAFGEGGKYVMTNRVFPSEAYNRLSFTSSRGSFTVKSLDIYPLK